MNRFKRRKIVKGAVLMAFSAATIVVVVVGMVLRTPIWLMFGEFAFFGILALIGALVLDHLLRDGHR